MKNAVWIVLCLAAAFLLQAGCGPSADARLRNDLKTTGLAWHAFQDEKQKAPASWDELIAYAKSANLSEGSLERVRDAKYDLKWNVQIKDVKDGLANTVLGERPGGGLKIMMDGSVQ